VNFFLGPGPLQPSSHSADLLW